MDYILDLDRPRKLRFGFKACRLIREKFGDREIDNIMNMKLDEMPAFAHAGLLADDPALTLEKTEELLDEAIPEKYTIVGIIKILTEAASAHIGLEKKKKKDDGTESTKSEDLPSGSESPTGNSTS